MKFLLLLALLPFIAAQEDLNGNFTIITPRVIRCGKPFNVALRGFGLTGDLKFTLRISGIADSGSVLSMKRVAKISDQTPKKLIQFDTSKIPQGTYNFTVSTINYSDTKALIYKTNEYAFLVQTDKAIYFPGDLIRFRVLAINSETKSVNPKRLPFISIKDAKGSVVLNISDTGFVKGKYQGELEVSSTPSFGFWHIMAQSGNDTGGRFIEVADIISPAIYSQLTVKPKIPIAVGIISLNITTKESYTGNVSGIAKLSFKKDGIEVFTKELDIDDAKTGVEVDLAQDLNESGSTIASYDIDYEYYDALTNSTITDLVTFEVLPNTYTITLSGDPFIKPGNDFAFSLVVVGYDGIPRTVGTTVDVTVDNIDVSQTLELNDFGYAESTFSVPLEASYVVIRAVSEDAMEAVLNVTLPLSLTGSEHGKKRATIRLDVVTDNPVVNEEVTVEVTLSEQIESVYCIITAKGLLLETIEVSININPDEAFQTAIFSFNPTFAYAPIASIIGYYVRTDGTIVTASTSVELTSELRNDVSYSLDVLELISGERYDYNLTSYLNSTVSMFAFDQRLMSLRDAVTITKNEVFSSLLSFYAPTPSASLGKIPDYELRFKFYGLNVFTSFKPHHSSYHYRKRSLLAELNESSKLNQTTSQQLGGSRQIKTLSPFVGSIFWDNYDIRQQSDNDSTGLKGYKTISGLALYNLATYVICSVSMNAYKGIGLPSINPKFGISMPFYLTANVPFSIKVSQTLAQGITLFQSYSLQTHYFNVSINKSPNFVTDYDGVKVSSTWIDAGDYYTKVIAVFPGKQNRVQFSLKAIKVGKIVLTISAISPTAADTIVKEIRVTPFGVYNVTTVSTRIKFTDTKLNFTHNLVCQYPSTFMEKHSANLTLSGDIMARAIANLPTGLINMPDGCGEQTLIYMVPDVVVWIYLTESNQMTTELQSTLQYYILSGYQRELSYARWDGGFAAWGNDDPHSSTWLTAYAGWAFYLANETKSVFIDPNVITRALSYLKSQQKSDGSFIELQPVYHTEMHGEVTFDITLTAYVTIYLTAIIEYFPQYKDMHALALTYLELNWHSRTDVFGLAIITYALSLNGSPKARNIMNLFFAKRTEDTNLNEIYYDAIETTSYCLLILLVRGERLDDAEKIANYLVRVSNQFGGYFNTQNTVMGVFALSRYALYTKNEQGTFETDLTIVSNDKDNITGIYNLSNATVVNVIKLNPNASSVEISSNGKRSGVILASLTCGFYEASDTYDPPFNITYSGNNVCPNEFKLKMTIRYNVKGKTTGMTTATITMPSGYSFNGVLGRNQSQMQEPKPLDDGHKVELYFNFLTNDPASFAIWAIKSSNVSGRLEGYIHVVDNYYPAIQASATFALPEMSLQNCDLANRRR